MLTLRSFLVLALLACLPIAVSAGDVLRVVDGDTFVLNGERIRLFGIDAPETSQKCDRNRQVWRCGVWSKRVLADLVFKGHVTCKAVDRDKYGRTVAICLVNGTDVGRAMVRAGAATAYIAYSDRYLGDETRAKAKRQGIWQGHMITPSHYRHPIVAPQPAIGGCAIKGNISKSGHIYHVPGQRDYAATRINPAKGEAWFCTETEARARGFRKAKR